MGMRLWWWIASILVIAAVVLALVKYVDGDIVVALLHHADWSYVLLAIVAVASLKLVEAIQFKVMTSKMADMSLGETINLYLASQAPIAIPGGVFFKAVLLQRETGTPVSSASPVVIMQSAIDYILLITAAVIGALYFQKQREWVLGAVGLLALILLLLSIRRFREWLTERIRHLAESRGIRERMLRFLNSSSMLLASRVLVPVVMLGWIVFVLNVTVLWLAARAFCVVGHPLEMALVFALPTVLGGLSGLPLGIGVLDATMVGALNLLPQVDLSSAVVVVGVYRLVRHLLPVVVGAILYFFIWLPARNREENGQGRVA